MISKRNSRGKAAGKRPSKTPAPPGPGFQALDIIRLILNKVLDRWVVLGGIFAYLVTFLGYVSLLPPEERLSVRPTELANALVAIIDSSWITIGGWLLLLIFLSVAVPAFLVQDKRIKNQGRELIRLRNKGNPNRLSASEPEQLLAAQKELTNDKS